MQEGMRKKQVMPPLLATRAPKSMWNYLAFLSKHPGLSGGGTLQEFLSKLAIEFLLVEQPWSRGMKLRQAISIDTKKNEDGPTKKSEIVQVNVTFQAVPLPGGGRISAEQLRELFVITAERLRESDYVAVSSSQPAEGRRRVGKVSTASLVYSFLYWASLIRFPPGEALVALRNYESEEKEGVL